MKDRSVLFLTSGRKAPSSRFRVLQYLDQLRDDGWTATVSPCLPDTYPNPSNGWPGRLGLTTAARVASRLWGALKAPGHEIVYLERELIPYVCPEPEQFLRMLDRVSRNEAFLHMARERATVLAEAFRKAAE